MTQLPRELLDRINGVEVALARVRNMIANDEVTHTKAGDLMMTSLLRFEEKLSAQLDGLQKYI